MTVMRAPSRSAVRSARWRWCLRVRALYCSATVRGVQRAIGGSWRACWPQRACWRGVNVLAAEGALACWRAGRVSISERLRFGYSGRGVRFGALDAEGGRRVGVLAGFWRRARVAGCALGALRRRVGLSVGPRRDASSRCPSRPPFRLGGVLLPRFWLGGGILCAGRPLVGDVGATLCEGAGYTLSSG